MGSVIHLRKMVRLVIYRCKMMASLTTFFKKIPNAYLDKNRLKKILFVWLWLRVPFLWVFWINERINGNIFQSIGSCLLTIQILVEDTECCLEREREKKQWYNYSIYHFCTPPHFSKYRICTVAWKLKSGKSHN